MGSGRRARSARAGPARAAGQAAVAQPVAEMIRTDPSEEDLDVISQEIEIDTALPLELELDLGDFNAESDLLR